MPRSGRRAQRAAVLGTALAAALAVLAVAALAVGVSSAAPAGPDSAGAVSLAAAAPPRVPAGVPSLEHVIVVVMENKNADVATDPRSCPYTAQLAATWVRFADSHAIAHPSQPNYLALWAGSTLGVDGNSCPAHGAPFNAENLGHALEAAGRTWRAYCEDLPAVGSTACKARGGLYARKHAPWANFKNLDHANERPYSDLAKDIASQRLPGLAFVIPNNCHNTHDCSVSAGDAWLAAELPAMISAVGNRGLVVLTWDEDDRSEDNLILTVFAGQALRPVTVSQRHITHYTVLRTLCDGLGLAPFGAAATESPITDVWLHGIPPADPKKP
ncbi:MAG: acid phosphatase [Candidatus Eisenbacteria bacterium]|uniref:Acid phosphatase n=1 Tax=Eiseniibacteriota bacterium TaxID=2212470 RepID=A0A538SST1_UNCEI|nr:MAG: acid phosphatase [Candidatus Eisenbacteria bacterium]